MPITHLTLKLGTFKVRATDKELIKVYLHLKCERVIDHGVGTMKLNTNNRFDLEIWSLQGQGQRQRSQWVELIKVYLHVKFERVIANVHSAMNLNAIKYLILKLVTFKFKVTDKGHNG